MIGALAAVLAHARLQRELVEADPVTAVHSFRKSVRRARSLVRFAEPWIGKRARKRIEGQLKVAFGPTSALRDGDVLAGVLAGLAERHPGLEPVVVARGSSGDPAAVLRTSVAALDGVEEAFAGVLPALAEGDLRTALALRFAATQRTRAAAGGDDLEAVHDWRKRTKELRYALELLDGRFDVEEPLAVLEGLAKELGGLADLLVVGAWLRAQGIDGGWRAAAEGEVRAGRDAALSGTSVFFGVTPGAFAAGV